MTDTPLKTLEPKYGLVLGRFQPFHVAHEAIVHEVMADGLTPIVLIGSSNVLNERNPFTLSQREEMIHKVFPEITVVPISDNEHDWDTWFKALYWELRNSLGQLDNSQLVWYINNKEKDRTYFEFKGKLYNNQFYTQVFTDLGFKVKESTYGKLLGLDINATDIRNNMEAHKHYLDARVYKYIQEIKNVKKKIPYFK